MSTQITAWRAEIDQIDQQLLELFNRRAHCAIEVGMVKRRLKQPIEVPEREAQIIVRMAELNAGPLDGDAIRRLFEAVIGESRVAERTMVEG